MLAPRRWFLELLSTLPTAACAAGPAPRAAPPEPPSELRAVVFDAFPVFDPRPIAARAEAMLPGRGEELVSAWRARQFEYTWLRVAGRRYRDFWGCTDDALRFAAAQRGIALTDAQREALMRGYLELEPWPDALAALHALRDAGLRLGFLSNFTPAMLESAVANAGAGALFEHLISTDRARTFKPDPDAYALGERVFGLRRAEILFVAFAGWDAAGATWFGYPTFWVNRVGLPPERLEAEAEGSGRELADLVRFVARRRESPSTSRAR